VYDATGENNSNSAGLIKSIIFAPLQARLSLQLTDASSRDEGEESPDSTEQCTGEEPGPDFSGTDSATENNYPDANREKGENVG